MIIELPYRWISAWLFIFAFCLAASGNVQAKGSMLDPVSTQVAEGYVHSCALTSDGRVMCWGSNDDGQLGNGGTAPSSLPIMVPGLTNVVSIAAGRYYSCALTTVGRVWCWGFNGSGQLGDGSNSEKYTPTAVGLDNVVAITAGHEHTCALTTAGAVYCWGANTFGELGDGTFEKRAIPTAVRNLAKGVVALSAGDGHTCAVTIAGSAYCWGWNRDGQLGNGGTTNSPTPVSVNDMTTGVTSIAAGGEHTCALTIAHVVRCWGSNRRGQLGDGTKADSPIPVDVLNISDVISLSSGGDEIYGGYSCAVVKGGSAYCWGGNFFGRLGDGSTMDQPLPVRVSGSFAIVSAGVAHTCAITSIGSAYCWGSNSYGQIGDGSKGTDRITPVGVYGLSSQISALGASPDFTCALVADTVQCWGDNSVGQLGDGTTTSRLAPVTVKGLPHVQTVAVGGFHACALTDAGTVWCWGDNSTGQLGDGTTTNRSSPVAVTGLSGIVIVAITAGYEHVCAVDSLGAVFCWGANYDGQLGDGTLIPRLAPVVAGGLVTGIKSVVAGGSHTCSLTVTGSMACWGSNDHGQLGDGTTTDRRTPGSISGLPGPVATIATGFDHTCAQTASGILMCWGNNALGQVGDGTTTDRSTPACSVSFCAVGAIDGLWTGSSSDHTWSKVRNQAAIWGWGTNLWGQLGLGDALAGTLQLQAVRNAAFNGLASGFTLATGTSHTCVSDDVGLRCMGANDSGQLGDGTTIQRNSPVTILAGQPISFSVPTTLADGDTLTLTASADSGLPVTFDSWTPSTCTVTGNTLKITAASLCGVRASQVGGLLSDGGSAAAAPQQLRVIQVLSATTITLMSSTNPSALGQSVTFTAAVTGAAPTGTVTFNDGSTVLCTAVALTGIGDSRAAACASTTLAVGTHPITAVYSGDTGNAASTSPVLNQIVQTTAGAVMLASSPNPSAVGQSVTFAASVTGTAPTGTVTFNDGAAILCNAVALTGTGNTRTATCSSATLTAGTHNMTAAYSGDSNNAAATSPVLVQTVQAAGLTPTTTTLNLSPNPATAGQSVTATVTVRPTSGTAVPSGTVTISGGATNCIVTLSAGAGSCALVFAAAGAYTVTANYGGSGTYAASGTTATVTVKASTSVVTVAAPILDARSLLLLVLGIVLLGCKSARSDLF